MFKQFSDNHQIVKNFNILASCTSLIYIAGITVAKKIDKMGMRCSDTAQIYFEDVQIPQDHVIGEEGMGFTYQMLQFQEERLYGAAASK